jgi:hypothetical protein
MTDDHRIGPLGRDDELTRTLRDLYAAPADAGYWHGLHARILARLSGEGLGDTWWAPLARWARVGAAAAAAAIVVSALTLWREREARARYAVETVLLQANPPHAQLTAAAGAQPDDDAVLRYLLTP